MSLQYSMDVQCSDGRSMLLRYISSNVTKLRDHQFLQGECFLYAKYGNNLILHKNNPYFTNGSKDFITRINFDKKNIISVLFAP